MDDKILRFFESIRFGFGTVFAGAFSLIGETLVVVGLIAVLYWLVDKRLGERLILTTFSSISVNGFLKGVVARPRPYVKGVVTRVDIDFPFLSTTDLSPYVSFPSGHSQMSGGFFFTLAFWLNERKKRVWAWILAPVCVLLVMCSRLYLGVHYPSDVVVGAVLGVLFAVLWHFIYAKWYEKRWFFAAFFAVLSVILLFISPNKDLAKLSGAMCSAAIFMPLEKKFIDFQIEKGALKKFLRLVVGGIPVGAAFLLFELLPEPSVQAVYLLIKWSSYFLMIFLATFLAPCLFKKLKI